MKIRYELILFILIYVSCQYFQKKETDSKQVFQNCMETFKDKEKCQELTDKTNSSENKQELGEEINDNLIIRKTLKNTVQSKNKLFVLNYLGEPDERRRSGSGFEYFIYTRPISKYSKRSKPDRRIKIVFTKKGFVQQVFHQGP